MRTFLIFVLGILAFTGSIDVHASAVNLKPVGYVNDFANILTPSVKEGLEMQLSQFTASTSNEIVIVTVPSLDGDTIEHYAVELFKAWKIGTSKHDNGILLLVSQGDRQMRIEVGYGLEGALPDILTKDIIDNQITPAYKVGNFDIGTAKGISSLMLAAKGEYQATPVKKNNKWLNENVVITVVMVLVFVFQFLASIFARSKSWWAGGVAGGALGGMAVFFHPFGMTTFVGILITVVLVLLGLLFDYVVSNTYNTFASAGSTIPWWVGGNGGGSSSSGSSFSGFGGGRSGGGGASGSW